MARQDEASIKPKEESFPSLIQTGESSSLGLILAFSLVIFDVTTSSCVCVGGSASFLGRLFRGHHQVETRQRALDRHLVEDQDRKTKTNLKTKTKPVPSKTGPVQDFL